MPIAAGQAATHFPAADVTNFRAVSRGHADQGAGRRSGGRDSGCQSLETAWDEAQPKLEALDGATWTAIDGRIDAVLTSIRDANPDFATETQTLNDLLTAFN